MNFLMSPEWLAIAARFQFSTIFRACFGYPVTAISNGESLKDTYERVTAYYVNEIEPELRKNNSILVVAHGNSLRALMMYLESISAQEIEDINIPTGVPRVYEYDAVFSLVKVYYIRD